MKSSSMWMSCAALLLAVAGCSDATPIVITAATDRVVVSLPDFRGPAELEEALISFGECVEEAFPIVMRFRADPFVGLATEVGSQRQDDGEQVEGVVAQCMGRLDLDRRLSVYQSEHPISPADQRELVEEFISCASSVSSEVSHLMSGANLESHSSVMDFVSKLGPPGAGLSGDDLIATSECVEEMTGPKRVFGEGHPWFTP